MRRAERGGAAPFGAWLRTWTASAICERVAQRCSRQRRANTRSEELMTLQRTELIRPLWSWNVADAPRCTRLRPRRTDFRHKPEHLGLRILRLARSSGTSGK